MAVSFPSVKSFRVKSILLFLLGCCCFFYMTINTKYTVQVIQDYGRPPDFGDFYYAITKNLVKFQNNQSAEIMAMEKENGTINPHPFEWTLLEKNKCKNRSDLFMLIIVHTAAQNLDTRNRIRKTWGSHFMQRKLKTALIFAVGQTEDKRVGLNLIWESFHHRDIIQENFMDTYRNLTYKSVMWLRYASTYCPNAKFLLKLDDDIFVNVFKMVNYLRDQEIQSFAKGQEDAKKIFCTVWYGGSMPVIRKPGNKWYVSKDDYESDSFSTYCSGWAYTLTQSLIKPMYKETYNTKFFWVDDFWTTGALIRTLEKKHMNVSYVNMDQYFPFGKNLTDNIISDELIFQWIGYMNDENYFREYKRLVPANFLKEEKRYNENVKLKFALAKLEYEKAQKRNSTSNLKHQNSKR